MPAKSKSKKTPRTEIPKPAPRRAASPWHAYAAVTAIVILYVTLRLPGIGVPLDRDEGAFGYIGQTINRSGLPYRDALDHKPPVAFYINAVALHVVPATETGVHWFLLIYNFATLISLFYAAKIYFKSLAAGMWTAFAFAVFSASPAIQGFTASTEMWSLLPIALSLVLAVLAIERGKDGLMLLSGAAGAAACWTKQTAFSSVLFILIYILAIACRQRKFLAPVAWLGGAMGFSGVVALYFYAHGIFREFLYWCFEFGATYASQASFGDAMHEMRVRAVEIMSGDGIMIAVAIGVAVWCVRRRQWFLAGFLLFSFAGTIPGNAYRHYFAQLAPAIALAAGYGLWEISNRKQIAAWVAAVAMIALPLFANAKYFFESDPNIISGIYFGLNPFPESKGLADYIAEHTAPSDKILVVGSEPQILFYAQRPSASRFVMLYPLMTDHARYREFQETLWGEAQQTKPKYVVAVLHLPFSLGWDQKADIGVMHKLEGLLQTDYELERVKQVGGVEGGWLDPEDPRLQSDNPFVYLFRRKS